MGRYNWILAVVFFSGFSVFSQEKYIKHTVLKGETISKIAQQYDVKSSAIYELNPDAKKGIKFKSILLIPTKVQKNENTVPELVLNYPEKTHTVLPKETIYGIAKQYGFSIKDLYKINPTLEKSGLRKGQKIRIPGEASSQEKALVETQPVKGNPKTVISEKNVQKSEEIPLRKSTEQEGTLTTGIVHEVLPKETQYGIAREYGIGIADLHKANPILESEDLKIGQKIIIPVEAERNIKKAVFKEEEVRKGLEKEERSEVFVKNGIEESANKKAVSEEKDTVADKEITKVESASLPQPIIENTVLEMEVVREVLPKETKYGIAKEFGITVKELERQNPKIVKKLPVGYKLIIRSLKPIEKAVENVGKDEATDETANEVTNTGIKSSQDADFLDQLVSKASENIGTRYRTGGNTKDGFDCSGLMCATFEAFDIKLPRTSFEQSQFGTKINIENAQKGDLIFFKTNGRNRINHVGMIIDVNDGDIKFIHASVGGGVIISSVKENYYSKRVIQVNRVL